MYHLVARTFSHGRVQLGPIMLPYDSFPFYLYPHLSAQHEPMRVRFLGLPIIPASTVNMIIS